MTTYLVGARNTRHDAATGSEVPEGVVHAVHAETRRTPCGVSDELLTVFEALDFDGAERLIRCPDCRRARES